MPDQNDPPAAPQVTGDESTDGDGDADTPPDPVVDEAERLTRQVRQAVDPDAEAAYREARAALLAEHDYRARVREDETRDVLVLHPAEWIEDGEIRVERVADVDRGIEIPLSGPGAAAEWETVEAHNREIAETVAADHGDPHGATAHALADFAGNHYAKPLTDLTPGELAEFEEEYLPRNAWPTDEQVAALSESLRRTYEAADADLPGSE
jgi:hypothetical protein